MTYDEAMKYIKEKEALGSKPGLGIITELLNRLGNPQDGLDIIHVAGTNGKGSTVSFLAAILAAAGYKTGIYVSPSVFSYREKLQIIMPDKAGNASYNGGEAYGGLNIEYISEDDVCGTLDIVKSACGGMVNEGYAHPTVFEMETAMAFLYMKSKRVDFLVLETGMGGRLDATNVVRHPVCCVLTSVSLDHMQYLGDTLEKIAFEKAGIMKEGSFAVTAMQEPEVLSVFKKKAKELKIPLVIADPSEARNMEYHDSHTEFDYPDGSNLTHYRIRMLGEYQVQNAVTAITAARTMGKMGYVINGEAIKTGLELAVWRGRFEKISSNPDIYIDGAHNEEAARRIRQSIEIYFTNRRLIFIIGVLADKDYKAMLRILAPLADTIIALTPENNRALASDKLAACAGQYCSRVYDEKDVKHAVDRALSEAAEGDVILAFGSLSYLGSIRSAVEARKGERSNG